jgi:hypothetical protein
VRNRLRHFCSKSQSGRLVCSAKCLISRAADPVPDHVRGTELPILFHGRLCTFSSGRVTTIKLPVNGIGAGLSQFGQFPALDVAVDRLSRSGFAFHEIIHFLLA